MVDTKVKIDLGCEQIHVKAYLDLGKEWVLTGPIIMSPQNIGSPIIPITPKKFLKYFLPLKLKFQIHMSTF